MRGSTFFPNKRSESIFLAALFDIVQNIWEEFVSTRSFLDFLRGFEAKTLLLRRDWWN